MVHGHDTCRQGRPLIGKGKELMKRERLKLSRKRRGDGWSWVQSAAGGNSGLSTAVLPCKGCFSEPCSRWEGQG